jgi:hypothetical protein
MTLPLIEDAAGDPRNAVALATASDLAYLDQAAGAQGFRDQLGMEANLYQAGNTQAFVAHNAEHILVAFRGTEAPTSIEGLKDWLLTDAMNLLIQPTGDLGTDFAAAGVGTRWHQGFIKALGDIWDAVLTAVQAQKQQADRPLWLTGHSLGGALALLAAWRFKRKFVPVHQVYTFGAPMVGNQEAAAAIDREFAGKVFRYVNGPDPVPRLPSMSLIANLYAHCQTEVSLGAAAVPFQELVPGLAARAVDGVLKGTLIDELWGALGERLGAHAMTSYGTLIKALLGGKGG